MKSESLINGVGTFDLTGDEQELFNRRLEEQGVRRSAKRAIPPRCLRDGAPLSFAQQRLWFIDQLEPGRATYNVPYAVRVEGPLQEALLERSLREIGRRHEVLRTSFGVRDGVPVQQIAPRVEARLWALDLTGLEAAERAEGAREVARRESLRPFDLSRGPLWRMGVLRLAERERVLLLTLHHIVSDGWSVGILVREFSALYTAFQAGEAAPLAELEIQYADFAAWQRGWLRGAGVQAQLDYLRRPVGGRPRLELPAGRARPAGAGHRWASSGLPLSGDTPRALK